MTSTCRKQFSFPGNTGTWAGIFGQKIGQSNLGPFADFFKKIDKLLLKEKLF
jgi:hypothetical protein